MSFPSEISWRKQRKKWKEFWLSPEALELTKERWDRKGIPRRRESNESNHTHSSPRNNVPFLFFSGADFFARSKGSAACAIHASSFSSEFDPRKETDEDYSANFHQLAVILCSFFGYNAIIFLVYIFLEINETRKAKNL